MDIIIFLGVIGYFGLIGCAALLLVTLFLKDTFQYGENRFTIVIFCISFVLSAMVAYLLYGQYYQAHQEQRQQMEALIKVQQDFNIQLQNLFIVKNNVGSEDTTKQDDLGEIKSSIEKTNKYLENFDRQQKNIEKMTSELQNIQVAISKIEDKLDGKYILGVQSLKSEQSYLFFAQRTLAITAIFGAIISCMFVSAIHLRRYFEKDAEIASKISSLYEKFPGK